MYRTYIEIQACSDIRTHTVETGTHTHRQTHTHTPRYLMFPLFEAKFLLSLLAIYSAPVPRVLRRVRTFHLRAIVCREANRLRTIDVPTDGLTFQNPSAILIQEDTRTLTDTMQSDLPVFHH